MVLLGSAAGSYGHGTIEGKKTCWVVEINMRAVDGGWY